MMENLTYNLGKRVQRQVYLLTYSRADLSKFPSRESFAEAVVEVWRENGKKILHWIVCREEHHDGDDAKYGHHYHMAVKLDEKGRWLKVKRSFAALYKVQINFSDSHEAYYNAYSYLWKEDPEPLLSPGHPDLTVPPRTVKATATLKENTRKRSILEEATASKSKRKRLTVFDVCQLIQEKGIKSRLELTRLAVIRNREGDSLLAQFIANRGSKAVDEALSIAKEFNEAEKMYERSMKSRLELLVEKKESECTEGCEGRWLRCALEIIEGNGINLDFFCNALHVAITRGRGKYQNVFIHGPANTGKTFILSPLKEIYKCFVNPARGSFAWMGVETAEVILLNDFRWHPTTISWSDFLQALEGDIVHFPAPKNFCRQDIELSKDTPFFATADQPLPLIRKDTIDQTNTEMMRVRWQHFHFWKQIPESQQLKLCPCAHCFASLVLDHNNLNK